VSSKKTLAEVIYLFRRAYPDQVEKQGDMKDLLSFYEKFFIDIPDEVLMAAALDHIAESQWWPKVSELRKRCVDLLMARRGLPTAGEAWQEVNRHLWSGHTKDTWTPLVKQAIDALGGMKAYQMSKLEDSSYWRHAFQKEYESLVARERRQIAMLPKVRTLLLSGRKAVEKGG